MRAGGAGFGGPSYQYTYHVTSLATTGRLAFSAPPDPERLRGDVGGDCRDVFLLHDDVLRGLSDHVFDRWLLMPGSEDELAPVFAHVRVVDETDLQPRHAVGSRALTDDRQNVGPFGVQLLLELRDSLVDLAKQSLVSPRPLLIDPHSEQTNLPAC